VATDPTRSIQAHDVRTYLSTDFRRITERMVAIEPSTDGAGGAIDVLSALQAGQVMTLAVNDDFEGTGWADYTMPAFGTGDLPTSHPLGGDVANLVEVDLQEEMARLAVQSDAEIDIVPTSVPADATDFQTVPQARGDIPR
jgi:hypothetical protein